MYSYQFLSKVNKINKHLTPSLTKIDGYSANPNAHAFNLPNITSNLSEDDLKDLEKGKEIIITIQTTETLRIKKL